MQIEGLSAGILHRSMCQNTSYGVGLSKWLTVGCHSKYAVFSVAQPRGSPVVRKTVQIFQTPATA